MRRRLVASGVVGHAALAARRLIEVVDIVTRLGEDDGVERNVAVGVVHALGHPGVIAVGHDHRELALGQIAASEVLGDGEAAVNRGRAGRRVDVVLIREAEERKAVLLVGARLH